MFQRHTWYTHGIACEIEAYQGDEKKNNYHNDNYNHFEPPFFIRCPRPAQLRFGSADTSHTPVGSGLRPQSSIPGKTSHMISLLSPLPTGEQK
jgi:hypothetical protein